MSRNKQRHADRTMSKDEEVLLENSLDALDRLFDSESSVIDLHALFFATAKALAGSEFESPFESVLPALITIIRTLKSEEGRRDAALAATDELRHFLADALPFPN